MAVEPEDVLRRGEGGGGGDGGAAMQLGGQLRGHQQQLQQPVWKAELKDIHMPHALRLQAVCGAVSCVDESPTAAASPGVSLLRNNQDGGAEHCGNEATSPHRKRGWFRQPGTFSRSLSRQPSRSGTDPNDVIRLDATSGESPTPSPGCVPCVRGRNGGNDTRGSSVPLMTAAQAAGTANGLAELHPASAGTQHNPPVQPSVAVNTRGGRGAAAAAGVLPSQQGAAAATVAPGHAASLREAPSAQQAAPAFDPNDLAAMNARLAAGLASLPPPPHSGCPSHGGGGGGGSSQHDGGGGGDCRKRHRSQDVDHDNCRLRGGDGGGIISESQAAAYRHDGDEEDESGPPPMPRPVKVQRIAVGMSTTDLPAVMAAARDEDEGTSMRHCPLDLSEQHRVLEPVLQLPPGCDHQRLPEVQVFNGFWGLDDVRRNRDCLFVFGDNDARQGFAGQAVIRGEPNAIGLTTKRIPSHVAHAYYRDEDFAANAAKISAGVVRILHTLLDGYMPDADAHPGVRTTQNISAKPAAGPTAGGGCADAAAAALAVGNPQALPELQHGNQQRSGQQQQKARHLDYRALVVPSDGFGTGRARLHTDAPRTFAFLKRQVCQLLELLQPGSSDALDW